MPPHTLQDLLREPGIVWLGASLPETDVEALLAEEGPAFRDLQRRTWQELCQVTTSELQEIERLLIHWQQACQQGRANNTKLLHRYMHDDHIVLLPSSPIRFKAIWGDDSEITYRIPDIGRFLLTTNRQLKHAGFLLAFRLNLLRRLRFHRLALGHQPPWDAIDQSLEQPLPPGKRKNIHRQRAEIAARLLDELVDLASLSDLAGAFESYGEDPVSTDTLSKSLQRVRLGKAPLYVPAKQGGGVKERKQAFERLRIQLKQFHRTTNKLTNEK